MFRWLRFRGGGAGWPCCGEAQLGTAWRSTAAPCAICRRHHACTPSTPCCSCRGGRHPHGSHRAGVTSEWGMHVCPALHIGLVVVDVAEGGGLAVHALLVWPFPGLDGLAGPDKRGRGWSPACHVLLRVDGPGGVAFRMFCLVAPPRAPSLRPCRTEALATANRPESCCAKRLPKGRNLILTLHCSSSSARKVCRVPHSTP